MTVAEVNAVAQAFHDGVANQDAAALASLYADDARFLPPNMEPSERARRLQQDPARHLQLELAASDLEPRSPRAVLWARPAADNKPAGPISRRIVWAPCLGYGRLIPDNAGGRR